MPWGYAGAAAISAYGMMEAADTNADAMSNQQQTNVPWEDQIPYLQHLFSSAQDWYDSGGMQAYDGQMIADLNPLITQGQDAQLFAGSGVGTELIGDANQAWQFAMSDVLNPDSNPYLQAHAQAAGDNISRQFNDNILPSLRLSSIAGNNFNSSRSALAEGQAAGEVGRAIADSSTRMYSDSYNQGLGTMMRALGMAPQMFQLNQMPGQLQQHIGAQRQAYEQSLLDAQRAIFEQNQQLPLQNLQAYQQLVGGAQYGGTMTGGQQNYSPGMDPIQAALGYGSMGLGLYNQWNQIQQNQTNPAQTQPAPLPANVPTNSVSMYG